MSQNSHASYRSVPDCCQKNQSYEIKLDVKEVQRRSAGLTLLRTLLRSTGSSNGIELQWALLHKLLETIERIQPSSVTRRIGSKVSRRH